MKKLILFALMALLYSGCGRNEYIIQKAEKSYLKFVGNTAGIQIVIDEGEPFQLDDKTDLYQVLPGKHSIKISRDSKTVVDRVILLDNKTTMEVRVP